MLAKQWIADKVAPSYWTPNSEIFNCTKCEKPFTHIYDKKHHCRGCGKGFCDKCSSKRKIIQWWSPTDEVRVCDSCYEKKVIPEPPTPNTNSIVNNATTTNALAMLPITGNNDVIVRKMSETVHETIGLISYATKIPFEVIKETARPSYWKPDSECDKCDICKKSFDDFLPLHHCRSCGNGVCHNCSPHQRPVPSRGWETPVRVCNKCTQAPT